MRRKFGIVILVGITVLAGTREAVQQFQCLKSSVGSWTRASLWSGLIVYAQPVSDGSLPSPQLYYLMPEFAPIATTAGDATLADNRNGGEVARTALKNNHAAQPAPATRQEVEEFVTPELITKELPLDVISSNFAAPQTERMRVFEEVAKNDQVAVTMANSEALAKVFVKEFDAAQHGADTARLAAAQEQIEAVKVRLSGEAERIQRRMEIKILRRAADRAPRPERPERIRVMNPFAGKREHALPEMLSVGCEKTIIAPPAPKPASEAAAAAAVVMGELDGAHIIVDVDSMATDASMGANWALDCGTEPFK